MVHPCAHQVISFGQAHTVLAHHQRHIFQMVVVIGDDDVKYQPAKQAKARGQPIPCGLDHFEQRGQRGLGVFEGMRLVEQLAGVNDVQPVRHQPVVALWFRHGVLDAPAAAVKARHDVHRLRAVVAPHGRCIQTQAGGQFHHRVFIDDRMRIPARRAP